MDKIYELKLHKMTEIKVGHIEYEVVRVPGGWLYQNFRTGITTFVPYSPEFKQDDNVRLAFLD